jgi:UPF0716 protein FxsA
MSLVKWGFVGLLMLPMAEIAAFIAVASLIGWLPAFALFIATSFAGVLVLRHCGRSELVRLREAAGGDLRTIRFETPSAGRMLAGILLVVPGFITDAIGGLLLLPAVRRWAATRLGRAIGAGRQRRDPSLIDLDPDDWHQISERKIDHKRPRRTPVTRS